MRKRLGALVSAVPGGSAAYRALHERRRARLLRSLGVEVGRDTTGAHKVAWEGDNVVGPRTTFEGDGIAVGRRSTIGVGCYLSGPLTMGRYCQLGTQVGIYGANHPTTLVTTYLNHRLLDGLVASARRIEPVVVGHGVWFGQGAVVVPGATVGNGAIIGAGAVVTSDIPAYAIAVGNPARVVRLRIPTAAAAAVEATRWWECDDQRLRAGSAAFLLDLTDAAGVAELERLLGSGS